MAALRKASEFYLNQFNTLLGSAGKQAEALQGVQSMIAHQLKLSQQQVKAAGMEPLPMPDFAAPPTVSSQFNQADVKGFIAGINDRGNVSATDAAQSAAPGDLAEMMKKIFAARRPHLFGIPPLRKFSELSKHSVRRLLQHWTARVGHSKHSLKH
ncbi:hypothetical protein [Corynebacterium renale]|uniref:hypothetical protein n=1 Tax=Corynebacterium renale TaxID=1724 RepID=UPI0006548278|nr:hypothetical protein [Corynebacterium renale]